MYEQPLLRRAGAVATLAVGLLALAACGSSLPIRPLPESAAVGSSLQEEGGAVTVVYTGTIDRTFTLPKGEDIGTIACSGGGILNELAAGELFGKTACSSNATATIAATFRADIPTATPFRLVMTNPGQRWWFAYDTQQTVG